MPLIKCNFQNEDFNLNNRTEMQDCILFLTLKKKTMNYKSQMIYRNERSFRLAMLDLIRQKMIRLKDEKNLYEDYELTDGGSYYVNHVLLK